VFRAVSDNTNCAVMASKRISENRVGAGNIFFCLMHPTDLIMKLLVHCSIVVRTKNKL
jgi:hypothetical protein